ncbi:MAG: 4-alpha-glucanotransferase [Clostridia bacterium]|nr:4-alpha-glucanotransferase [Clostridia bacterium]
MRRSGVLMAISSLPSGYSIGNFGIEAYRFVDRLAEGGFKVWQILPLSPIDECHSPYKSTSAYAIDPYYLDLEDLYRKLLISIDELEYSREKDEYLCEYERLGEERWALLKKASARVVDRSEYLSQISSLPKLYEYCRYMSLKELNEGKPWYEWSIQEVDEERTWPYIFVQVTLYNQWLSLKSYANSKGVSIIGDMPIYVSHDSADVWANREYFQLDKRGLPTAVAGVPPDYFCQDGQLWGNPLYDWSKMKKDGYAWWRDRLSHALSLYDGVRIDHFRAFSEYWSVPSSATTAKEGKWRRGPGKSLIDAIADLTRGRLVIAEDLGDIDDKVIDLLEYSRYPGMRVWQFGFLTKGDSVHRPHNYTENCVAYTGTHDNNTLLGYVWEMDSGMRDNMLSYIGYTDANWDRCYDSIVKILYMSRAKTVILPLQDLLGYGADTRLNIPGQAGGNWRYRATKRQIESIDMDKFRTFGKTYNR